MKTVFIFIVLAAAAPLMSATRPFHMGFTPWPYEATAEGVDWVYAQLDTLGDIISHHMEEGVPWPEAYAGTDFSAGYLNEIQGRLDRLRPGQKVVLSVNPLNIDRNGLAPYRGDTEAGPLPVPWDTLALNSDMVKTAYLNYVRRMIGLFDPDYLNIGIEVNLLVRNNPSLWPEYVELHQYVYQALKSEFAGLPVAATFFCVPFFPEWTDGDDSTAQQQALADLEPYMDYAGFSLHPFMSALLCETFPDDYFQRLYSLTEKPVAVTESSYPAQVWQTMSDPVLTFNGSAQKQETFVSRMLVEADTAEAYYVIWWCVRDFDILWANELDSSAVGLVWRDTGLFDETGAPREALADWQAWYGRPYAEPVTAMDAPPVRPCAVSVPGARYDLRGRRLLGPVRGIIFRYGTDGVLYKTISME